MTDDGIRATLRDGVVAINSLAKAIASVFTTSQATATSATAGTNGAPPAQVSGYLVVLLPGTTIPVKIPYYAP